MSDNVDTFKNPVLDLLVWSLFKRTYISGTYLGEMPLRNAIIFPASDRRP